MKKGIVVFDLHYPHHHKTLWKNILKVIENEQPDYFVFGGDNMNFDAVDHWKQEKGQKRPLEGKRLKKEYQGFQKDILDVLEDKLPPTCEKHFKRGNHEDWVEKYIDKHPEVEGLLEIENNLKLDNWEDTAYGKTTKIGKLYFDHGRYINDNSAKKTVMVYGRNVVYGHGHTLQCYTATTPIDKESHMSMQIPCACEMNPYYMRNQPNSWLNGFGVFYIDDRGNFNLYPVIATNGHFIFNGIEY